MWQRSSSSSRTRRVMNSFQSTASSSLLRIKTAGYTTSFCILKSAPQTFITSSFPLYQHEDAAGTQRSVFTSGWISDLEQTFIIVLLLLQLQRFIDVVHCCRQTKTLSSAWVTSARGTTARNEETLMNSTVSFFIFAESLASCVAIANKISINTSAENTSYKNNSERYHVQS